MVKKIKLSELRSLVNRLIVKEISSLDSMHREQPGDVDQQGVDGHGAEMDVQQALDTQRDAAEFNGAETVDDFHYRHAIDRFLQVFAALMERDQVTEEEISPYLNTIKANVKETLFHSPGAARSLAHAKYAAFGKKMTTHFGFPREGE